MKFDKILYFFIGSITIVGLVLYLIIDNLLCLLICSVGLGIISYLNIRNLKIIMN